MLIQSESVLAALTKKAQGQAHDRSRHLLCPSCGIRTKLYALKDGRRKCSVCGTKFSPDKKTDTVKLRQYAELLLCFCLDITARQASDMTGHRYRLVSAVYDHLRTLLAAQNLTPGKSRLLTDVQTCDRGVHDSSICKRCRGRFACAGHSSGDSPIFGVKMLANQRVFIDPLTEEEADTRFPDAPKKSTFSGYAGFVCKGTFHRFADNERVRDGAEGMWAWMSERLKKHHGIWKKNTGLYLKELEWKFNNRNLEPEAQALAIVEIIPADFLHVWKSEKIELDLARPA